MKFPIKYKDRYIHEYFYGNKEVNYCIGFNEGEVLIDEEEAGFLGLDEYQDVLKKFGAKQYEHTFHYGDGVDLIVQDSYFDTVEQCKETIDYLIDLEKRHNEEIGVV